MDSAKAVENDWPVSVVISVGVGEMRGRLDLPAAG